MTDQKQVVVAARHRASEVIAKAQAELVKAADRIADEHGLPEGINGLSRADFLGRLSFVVSLSRDLRNAGEEHLAAAELKAFFKEPTPIAQALDAKPVKKPEVQRAEPSPASDVGELAITPQVAKALKQAGIHTVEEVEKYTDEALLAVRGIAQPSLEAVRAAIQRFHGSVAP